MQPTKEFILQIDREKIERARRMSPAEKFWAGAQLFDNFAELARAGIQMQFPDADPQEVRRILRERLAVLRRAEYPR